MRVTANELLVWMELGAKVTEWALAIAREIDLARRAAGITDAEWAQWKAKNEVTLDDLVRAHGAEPPNETDLPSSDPYFREMTRVEFSTVVTSLFAGDHVYHCTTTDPPSFWIEHRSIGGPPVPDGYELWYTVGG